MPNWCDNTISITGPAEKLSPMYTKLVAEEEEGLLSILYPQPADIFKGDLGDKERKQCAKDGVPNWYDWNSSNWGTKWDITDEGLEYVDNKDGTSVITGWFDSAWAPPIEAYNTFLDDMDNCSIEATYEEGGMDFAGIYTDGDDQYMEGLSEWCEAVVKGTCALEDTPELFQKLDDEFEFIENRREWIEEEMEEEKAKEKVN